MDPLSTPSGNSMTSKSSIEWTEITWNPVTGYEASQGCKFCYEDRMAILCTQWGQLDMPTVSM